MDLTNPLPFRHQRDAHLPKPLDISMALLVPKPNEAQQGKEPRPSSNSFPTSAPLPRTPVPPHKLVKLANALGVSTPMPALYRSPSPSGSSSFRSSSRYLLHIVPPPYFPSDEDDDGPDPDGASVVSASSYRSQFRRGTLIPLYPTLQSQLGAIAREYNLPSTGGLVLYLVQSSQGGTLDGPRISDDVWRLLWHKALQAERQDAQSRTASSFGLRSGHSTPSSPSPNYNRDLSPPLPAAPRAPPSPCPYPSPLTSSTPSSEAYLPLSDQHQMSTSDLASLNLTPNPFLPILAKVEFDLDRRKAGWFDAWARDKRERSRWRNGSESGRIQLELPRRSESRSQNRFLHEISTDSGRSSEYAPLDDAEGENTAVDDDEQDQPTVVVRSQDPLAEVFGNDAETWSEMHAGRQSKDSSGLGISTADPELIIPRGSRELDHEEGIEAQDEADVVKLWDENHRPTLTLGSPDPHALSRKMAPPPLKLTPSPDSEQSIASPPLTRGLSVLPYLSGLSPFESESGGSESERYDDKRMRRRTGVVFGDLQVKIFEEPEQLPDAEFIGHRSSQVVMKHKLDRLEKQLAELSPRQLSSSPSPMPPGTPEHETDADRPLRSAPPGVDKFAPSPSTHTRRSPSMNSPPRQPDTSNPTTPVALVANDLFDQPPSRNESLVASAQPPRVSEHKRAQSSQSSSSASSAKSSHDQSVAAWPSVAYSSLPKSPALPGPPTLPGRLQDRSPPQLTIKRASNALRKPVPTEVSNETKARAFESDGQDVLLQERPGATLSGNPNSPVIPLSPDPFGKRPLEDLRQPRLLNESNKTIPNASECRPPSRPQGTVLPASVPENQEIDAQSSRFSADSEHGIEELSKQRRSRSNSIMSVRSLRNLWRKSTPGKGSGSSMPPPPMPGDPSPLLPSLGTATKHSRGESTTSQPSVRSTAERTHRPSIALRPDSGSDPFQFDNANIYKSPSSSSLASAAIPAVPNYASSAGSINQSKGILKGWTGNTNLSDAEARRMRRPSLANQRRSMSTTSASLSSDPGELPIESQQSTPPSSPPDVRRASVRHKQAPPSSQEPMLVPRSLPTASAHGLSRHPEAPLSLSSSLDMNLERSSTPQSLEFEIVAPPIRSAGLIPSSSYNGEVF